MTRRSWLRIAGAFAAGSGGMTLAACRRVAAGAAPAPTSAGGRIALTLQPSGALPFNATMRALYERRLEPFLRANPGLDVAIQPTAWSDNAQRIQIGQAADVIADNYPPPYFPAEGPLLLPLDAWMRRDGVADAAFSAGQIAAFRALGPGQALFMLPSHCNPVLYVVRLGDFQAAGLDAPGPEWTAQDFSRMCAVLAGGAAGSGGPRYGAVLAWDSTHLGRATWPFAAWGGGILSPNGQAALASSTGVTAGQYLYGDLLWPGRATTWDLLGPTYGSTEFSAGRVAMQLVWGGLVLDNAQRLTGFDWDYLPPPVFPQGAVGPANADFYAIPASTAHPEQAWALLRFLAAGDGPDGWPAGMVRLGLLQPALLSLWPTWIAAAGAVAPPLAGKRLEYFQDMAVSGRALPQQYWPRLDPVCQTLTASPLQALWSQATEVASAFGTIDLQVDALLSMAAAQGPAEARAAQADRAVVAGPAAHYAAPAPGGAGLAPLPAEDLVAPGQASGSWLLLGDGGTLGGTADAAVFAAAAATVAEGQWTVRLSGLAALAPAGALTGTGGAPAAGWAAAKGWNPDMRVGLMARADLSDDAAFVALLVTGDGTLELANRPAPWGPPVRTPVPVPAAGSGAAGTPSRPAVPPPAALPLWLRLSRQGLVWQGSVSRDGVSFVAVGSAQTCPGLGGAWIGPAACGGNGAPGQAAASAGAAPAYVRAAFDGVSPTPTQLVQVGSLGLPAGALPAGWQTAP